MAAALIIAVALPSIWFSRDALVRVVMADATIYPRTAITFQGGTTQFRTRGFLDDLCMTKPLMPCLTFTTKQFRQEGTAQAIAIQQLRQNRLSFYALPNAAADPVQWEVAPPTVPDPTVEITDASAEVTCPTDWRADIVTDDGPNGLHFYEVKNWSVGRATTRAQLTCYLNQATTTWHLNAAAGEELMAQRWAVAYPDNTGHVWCAWADQRDPVDVNSGPGLIFFARQSDPTLPPAVAAVCTIDETKIVARCADIQNDGTPCALTTALALLALIAIFAQESGAGRPEEVPTGSNVTMRPYASLLPYYGWAWWTVRLSLPTVVSHLLIDWGDGTYSQISLPFGPGQYANSFSHAYVPGFTFTMVRALIPETGQEADSIFAEDSGAMSPAILGTMGAPCLPYASTIAAGGSHALALGSAGDVWSWGSNTYGELGHDAPVENPYGSQTGTPGLIAGLHGVVALSAGDFTSFALRGDGTVWSWGDDYYGELGNGTAITLSLSSGPTLVGKLKLKSVKAGVGTAFAIAADGTLYGWGRNESGQVGNNSATNTSTPANTGLANVSAVSVASHTIAVDTAGNAYGWGSNVSNALGVGTVGANYLTPQAVRSGVAPSLATAYQASAFRLTDGTAVSAGRNTSGQLGQGTVNNADNPLAPIQSLSGISGLSATSDAMSAVRSDGTVATWGSSYSGQLGLGTGLPSSVPTPTTVPLLSGVLQVSAGGADYMLALKSDGSMQSWGNGLHGQLGDGRTFSTRYEPGPIQVATIAVPGGCTLALAGAAPASAGGTLTATQTSTPATSGSLAAEWKGASTKFEYQARPTHLVPPETPRKSSPPPSLPVPSSTR